MRTNRHGEPAGGAIVQHALQNCINAEPVRMGGRGGGRHTDARHHHGGLLMKETKARRILQALVQGIDPITGEELAPGTVLQHADVLRALLAGAGALESMAARAHRRAQLPDNVGQTWTPDEENALASEFKAGESVADIAAKHGRTLRAIEA